MMNISIRLWFVGGEVDWTMNTSSPLTFSSILTNVSPSGNDVTEHLPNSIPLYAHIARANGSLEVPLKIFTLDCLFRIHPGAPKAPVWCWLNIQPTPHGCDFSNQPLSCNTNTANFSRCLDCCSPCR